MKKILVSVCLVAALAFLIVACEEHGDPFSALNKTPAIQEFTLPDSIKSSTGDPVNLRLVYEDEENQELTATFVFEEGDGSITHSSFTEVGRTNNSVTFSVPSSFNDNLQFLPSETGNLRIELTLSDKVKSSSAVASSNVFDNKPPVATFSSVLLTEAPPYQVSVDASASFDRDEGGLEWYNWDFGDGSAVVRTNDNALTHSYENAGTYTISLKVEDNEGAADSTEQVIQTENQPPLAVLQVTPVNGQAPHEITYTATNSVDPDGEISVYRIDFDDGSSVLNSAGTYTYANDGSYTVQLTVEDNLGRTDTASVTVSVVTLPVVNLEVDPLSGDFPLITNIVGNQSFDPQGGEIDHDIYIDNTLVYDNIDSVQHTFDEPGTFLVTMRVTNRRNGEFSEESAFVNAINLDPIADFTWSPEIPQNGAIVTYTSTSTDPNLTDEIVNYKWTFLRDSNVIVVEGPDKNVVTEAFDAGPPEYPVILEVTDKFGGVSSITYMIPKE